MTARITRPGLTDDEHMVVTCTPDKTAVDFYEFAGEALDAARANVSPVATTYVAKVTHQGEDTVRGTAKHIALLVEVGTELKQALLREFGARNREQRAAALDGILKGALAALCGVTRGQGDEEKTQSGAQHDRIPLSPIEQMQQLVRPAFGHPRWGGTSCSSRGSVRPSCHPGDKCENWPACESCGPPRI